MDVTSRPCSGATKPRDNVSLRQCHHPATTRGKPFRERSWPGGSRAEIWERGTWARDPIMAGRQPYSCPLPFLSVSTSQLIQFLLKTVCIGLLVSCKQRSPTEHSRKFSSIQKPESPCPQGTCNLIMKTWSKHILSKKNVIIYILYNYARYIIKYINFMLLYALRMKLWINITNTNKVLVLFSWATDFIFLYSKITAESDCSHEIKRHLLLGRKAMTNLDSILTSRNIT